VEWPTLAFPYTLQAEVTFMKPDSPRRATAMRRTARAAFSLVELMMVVAIVGILSVIAIPSFQSYIYKSRTSEAIETLGAIKLREESYRSEFGQYCETTPTAGATGVSELDTKSNLVPDPEDAVTDRGPVPASGASATTGKEKFRQLGMRFTNPLRFGYGVAAGPPTALPDASFGWNATNADFWFIARAVADLDYDGKFVTFEIYSSSTNRWVGDDDSANDEAESKGWE
jgi:prepilin-type N-terminal cleavage/methylation domain-containing protein